MLTEVAGVWIDPFRVVVVEPVAEHQAYSEPTMPPRERWKRCRVTFDGGATKELDTPAAFVVGLVQGVTGPQVLGTR